MKTHLLVDGNNLASRAMFAARTSAHLSDSQGRPTGALLIFANMLSRVIREHNPDKLAVMFDSGGPTWRHDIYPEYKAKRRTKPQSYTDIHEKREAFGAITEFLDAAGVFHFAQDGVEADDLIAAAWQRAKDDGDYVLILSGDKDLLQLIDGLTKVIRPTNEGLEVWDEQVFVSKHGFKADCLPFWMSLTGDSSDSLPGVQGIGPKRATSLLSEYYWDLDALLEAQGLAEGKAHWDTEKRESALRTLLLVDLRYGFAKDSMPTISDIVQGQEFVREFPPASGQYGHLVEFANKYDLKSLVDRVARDGTW